ncbi:MAG: YHS domain-containing (seleno)protein [Pseudomonadota bacterium]
MTRPFLIRLAAIMLFLPVFYVGSTLLSRAVTTEVVVVDPTTGVAIYGFDPVMFFIEQNAVKGQPDFEVEWEGAHWQFTSAANAARFADAPAIYAPRFNGYGAFAISQGRIAEGNPLIWAIYENQLYFFHSANARARWARDVSANVEAAKVKWTEIYEKLAR